MFEEGTVMRVTTVVAAGLVVGVALSGCGGSSSGGGSGATSAPSASSNGIASMSVPEILDKTATAAKAQKSVHISGKGTNSGQAFAIDMTLRNGGGGKGSITIDSDTLNVINTGSTVYIKADKAYWTKYANATAAAVIGDRWVKAPASDASYADLASLADFMKSIESYLKPTGTPTKGAEKTVAGQPALGLVDSDGGTLWIATTGDPLPVLIESSSSGGGGLAFADWNKTVDITPPADADTLDLGSLSSGG
jgi:hypothetical protein